MSSVEWCIESSTLKFQIVCYSDYITAHIAQSMTTAALRKLVFSAFVKPLAKSKCKLCNWNVVGSTGLIYLAIKSHSKSIYWILYKEHDTVHAIACHKLKWTIYPFKSVQQYND